VLNIHLWAFIFNHPCVGKTAFLHVHRQKLQNYVVSFVMPLFPSVSLLVINYSRTVYLNCGILYRGTFVIFVVTFKVYFKPDTKIDMNSSECPKYKYV